MTEDGARRWIDPIYGWRAVRTSICVEHGQLGLTGARGQCIHTSLSEPARCIMFAGPFMREPTMLSGPEGVPHDEQECRSVTVSGNACGYYASLTPDQAGATMLQASAWAYVAAVGKTFRHETGFRTAQLRLVALFPGLPAWGAANVPGMVIQAAERLGVPLVYNDASLNQLGALGVPVEQVRRLRPCTESGSPSVQMARAFARLNSSPLPQAAPVKLQQAY